MINPNKNVNVVFADTRIKKAFDKLKEGKFEDRKLHKFITRAFIDLKDNPFCGMRIQKKLIPKEYKTTNLWKYDLPNAWRLIYTLKQDSVAILAIFLEWFNHKNYERKFKYS